MSKRGRGPTARQSSVKYNLTRSAGPVKPHGPSRSWAHAWRRRQTHDGGPLVPTPSNSAVTGPAWLDVKRGGANARTGPSVAPPSNTVLAGPSVAPPSKRAYNVPVKPRQNRGGRRPLLSPSTTSSPRRCLRWRGLPSMSPRTTPLAHTRSTHTLSSAAYTQQAQDELLQKQVLGEVVRLAREHYSSSPPPLNVRPREGAGPAARRDARRAAVASAQPQIARRAGAGRQGGKGASAAGGGRGAGGGGGGRAGQGGGAGGARREACGGGAEARGGAGGEGGGEAQGRGGGGGAGRSAQREAFQRGEAPVKPQEKQKAAEQKAKRDAEHKAKEQHLKAALETKRTAEARVGVASAAAAAKEAASARAGARRRLRTWRTTRRWRRS